MLALIYSLSSKALKLLKRSHVVVDQALNFLEQEVINKWFHCNGP